jgi:hypothetical protein
MEQLKVLGPARIEPLSSIRVLIRGIPADPPRVLPDLSQRKPGIVETPNNAMNAAWRRGTNPASNGSMIDEQKNTAFLLRNWASPKYC